MTPEIWDRIYGFVMGSPPIVQQHVERATPKHRAYVCAVCSSSGAVPVDTERPSCWNCGASVKRSTYFTTGDFVKGATFEDFLET